MRVFLEDLPEKSNDKKLNSPLDSVPVVVVASCRVKGDSTPRNTDSHTVMQINSTKRKDRFIMVSEIDRGIDF